VNTSRVEWPTVLLGVAIYGGWLLLTSFHHDLPTWAIAIAGAWLLAWHGSLQHEAVHLHPFPSRRLNALFAGIPITLWLPFQLYRSSHLAHHGVRELTDPDSDPESFYVSTRAYERATPFGRAWLIAESTLLGRLVLGPLRVVARTVLGELASSTTEPLTVLWRWAIHALAITPILYWVVVVCEIPLTSYLLLYVYPGLALTLLRSFVEHRAEGAHPERSVIVEAEAPLSWLFLHNNLHALHHAEPALPWYALPARYRERRSDLLQDNGHFFFRGYRAVLARYLFRPKGPPVHPGVSRRESEP
jgi:fatty acid desaturase